MSLLDIVGIPICAPLAFRLGRSRYERGDKENQRERERDREIEKERRKREMNCRQRDMACIQI